MVDLQVGEAGTAVIERLQSPPDSWIVCATAAVQEDVGPKAAVVGELQEGEVRRPILKLCASSGRKRRHVGNLLNRT